jgi:hypothetical protein
MPNISCKKDICDRIFTGDLGDLAKDIVSGICGVTSDSRTTAHREILNTTNIKEVPFDGEKSYGEPVTNKIKLIIYIAFLSN